MIGLGIAAASLSTFATGIESANIVGYTTSTLEAGKYNLISLPFAGVDGGNQKLSEAMKTMLGINPTVHLVPPKSITRSEGKAVRVIDKRKLK